MGLVRRLLDSFDADTSVDYAQHADIAGTWVWNTTEGRLENTGGRQDVLIHKDFDLEDVILEVTTAMVDDGGIIARFVDNNNYYLLGIRDDGTLAGHTNNLAFYRRQGGTFSELAFANVTMPRGTEHTVRLEVVGDKLTAYLNDVEVFSVVDSTHAKGGVGVRSYTGTTSEANHFNSFAVYEEVPQTYPEHVLADGPVGYWRLEDNLQDESGNGHHGTAVGAPAFVAGLLDEGGRAVSLDGNDGIDTALALATGSSERTYESWVIVQASTEYDPIVHQGNEAANGNRFTMRKNATGSTQGIEGALRVDVQGGYIVGTTRIDDGVAHHVVAVLPSGATSVDQVLLYVDGTREAISASAPQAINIQVGDGVQIGYESGLLRYLTGTVDEAAVYDRALTHAEILEHYRVGKESLLQTSGLLARHEAGSADFPFRVEDWDLASGLTATVTAAGKLRHTHSDIGYPRWSRHKGIGGREKSLTHIQMRGPDGYIQGFPLVNIQDITYLAEDGSGGVATLGRTAGELSGLMERVAGSSTDNLGAVALKSATVDHRFSLYADAGALHLRDFTEGLEVVDTFLTYPSGGLGIGSLITNNTTLGAEFASYFACTDRYVEVTGIPAGEVAEVLDGAGVVLASATADAYGVALVDLLTVALPEPKSVRAGDLTIAPTLGVWPGDSYDASTATYNEPPATPTISAGNVTDTTADLSSSVYSDPDGDAHASSQWQVDVAAGDFTTPVVDSLEDATNLVAYTATGLTQSTDYKGRVRHRDATGLWSDWSTPVPFTTLETEVAPNQPTITATVTGKYTADLAGSAFADTNLGDTHAASRWQVQVAGGDWTLPVIDTGPDAVNLVSYAASGLEPGTGYQARVQYQDSTGLWSNWSAAASFTTVANQPPTPDFTVTGNFLEVAVDAAASIDPDGSIVSYEWNWGDGTPLGAGQQAAHTYATDGWYTITLTITDDGGVTSSLAREVWVSIFREACETPPDALWEACLPPAEADPGLRQFQGDFETPGFATAGASTGIRPDAVSLDHRTAFSYGPTALSDNSMGLAYKAWRLRVVGNDLVLDQDVAGSWGNPVVLRTVADGSLISEMSLAFDQNGQAVFALELQGEVWIHRFDALSNAYVFENLGAGRTPRIFLDTPDKIDDSDLHVFYFSDAADALAYRTQRENYQTVRTIPLSAVNRYLEKVLPSEGSRIKIIYSERDPVSGTYSLRSIYTRIFNQPFLREAVGFGSQAIEGSVLTVVIPVAKEEGVSFGSTAVGAILREALIEYDYLETVQFGGNAVSASVVVVVITYTIDNEVVSFNSSALSGSVELIVITETYDETVVFQSSAVAGTLETV